MTGQDRIIALRRAGYKPDFVWVSDHDHGAPSDNMVRVCGDTPELLDLRFLVGTTALVEGSDAARVDRIAEVCKPIAKRVIATTSIRNGMLFDVVRITDTEGVMTWPN